MARLTLIVGSWGTHPPSLFETWAYVGGAPTRPPPSVHSTPAPLASGRAQTYPHRPQRCCLPSAWQCGQTSPPLPYSRQTARWTREVLHPTTACAAEALLAAPTTHTQHTHKRRKSAPQAGNARAPISACAYGHVRHAGCRAQRRQHTTHTQHTNQKRDTRLSFKEVDRCGTRLSKPTLGYMRVS
jgi:hypothetical protein